MATEITWLGHGCWSLTTGEYRLLLDPFLSESPTAPLGPEEVEADYILLSHGHFDHIGDTVAIAQRTGATVIACFELCEWLVKQGVERTEAMNTGGTIDLPFGHVKMTHAVHSSVLPDGTHAGNPAGFLLTLGSQKIYFACDTALFADMQTIGAGGLDLAVLPIGDRFTMGPDDAIEATKLLQPKRVAPAHYATWPQIEQDAAAWGERIKAQTSAEPVVLEPGQSFSLS